jgi:xanthine dehydrogenase accessory factor
MRNLINQINKWHEQGKTMALATVIGTWGSAPRKIGSHMVINEDTEFVGSVSGGCVEGAVISASLEVIESSESTLLAYGVSDDDAWEVGLACGGNIEIFVIKLSREIINLLNEMVSVGFIGSSIIKFEKDNFPSTSFSLVETEIPNPNKKGEEEIVSFFNHYPPPLHLIIIGGSDIGVELAKIARYHAFKISIIDPRKVFAKKNRFESNIEVFSEWPNKILGQAIEITTNSAIVSLSHDPKIDDVGLELSLRKNAFYTGALGSKKTHAKRLIRLSKIGLSDIQLKKIKGPIGLNINAITPAEIAVSILAEIIQEKNRQI